MEGEYLMNFDEGGLLLTLHDVSAILIVLAFWIAWYALITRYYSKRRS